MGKKKHKGERRKHDHAEMRFDMPPEVAGLAAMALQQINTPAFRQLMTGALGAAAQAFDQRRTPPPPATPASPPPPVEPAAHPASSSAEFRLPPEAAQAIEQVARQAGQAIESAATLAARAVETAAVELARWANQQRTSREAGAQEETPAG